MAPGERPNPGRSEAPKAVPPRALANPAAPDLQEQKTHEELLNQFRGGSNEKLERELFGATSYADEVVRDVTSRFNENDKTYGAYKAFAIAAMRSAGEKLFRAKLKQLEAEGKTINASRDQLKYLSNDFWEVMKAQQRALKVKVPDFDKRADRDVLNQEELMELRGFAEILNQLESGEIETMISENLPITQMLQEQDVGGAVGGAKHKLLDSKNPSYKANMDVLMHFAIGGKVEAGDKEKSPRRKQGEALMWEAVVRGMSFEQKRDLILHFTAEAKPEETKRFIRNSIGVSAMSRAELKRMQKDFPPGELTQLFDAAPGQGSPQEKFDEFLSTSVKVKDAFAEITSEQVKQMGSPSQKSGVKTFLNFKAEGGEMLFRLGAITALLNGTLDVMDAINARIENKQSMPAAILAGLKEAAKDKYVWGGVAAAAVGSELVYPWMKDFAYSPSGKEKDAVFAQKGQRFLREQADNHREIMDYVTDNFEDFRRTAKLNESNTNPKQERPDEKFKKRGAFDLYPGDFKLPEGLAGQAGFENRTQAEAAVIQTFAVLSRNEESKDINTQVGLKKYLRKFYGETV